MFEDSTFESAGRIHTRSRRWMIAAFTFNASILLAFILIPLLRPEALPRLPDIFLMEPPPLLVQQPLPQQPAQTAQPATQMLYGQLFAPSKIPPTIMMVTGPEPAINLNPATWVSISDPGVSPFGKGPGVTVVQPVVRNPIHVSSTAEEALITGKTMPVYPPIARAARVEGTVRLAATISKTGNIENLRVTSGPAMLQQAALDAVRSWRYRPYILDGQPVEVETTVDVIFTLSR